MTTEKYESEILEYIATHKMNTWNSIDTETIAKKLMLELVKSGFADFLLLREDDISKWWGDIVNVAQRAIAQRREKQRLYTIKLAAWEKLSPDERKSLGIKKPIAPRG